MSIKYFRIRRDDKRPVITIASTITKSAWDDAEHVVSFGYSICNPKDQFIKATGNALAVQCMEEKKMSFYYRGKVKHSKIAEEICTRMLTLDEFSCTSASALVKKFLSVQWS
jgi:hypothetical protein